MCRAVTAYGFMPVSCSSGADRSAASKIYSPRSPSHFTRRFFMKLSSKRTRAWTELNVLVTLGAALLLAGCGLEPASDTGLEQSGHSDTAAVHSDDAVVSRVVPEGFQALTVQVKGIESVAGPLKPRDRCNVTGTFVKPGGHGPETVTLLHHVEVQGIGRDPKAVSAKTGSSAPPREDSVTLLVSHNEAELLIFAQDRGELRLTSCDRDSL
ncbi:MAG: hypothetical protein CL928_16325 [Deltaproteobacteria bacterium]|nr:hypothetical protein [Deltaproteobacteria bacterium]|tara:strand:+ start:623 stop:1255 length:633 start_codon:yes stop_codon:yes gene_type:complete